METYTVDKTQKKKPDPFQEPFPRDDPDLSSWLLVSQDGLPIESSLPDKTDEIRYAGMIAALTTLGERFLNEMGMGELNSVYVETSEGQITNKLKSSKAILSISTKNRTIL